jgi:putative ABC transport system permease protein
MAFAERRLASRPHPVMWTDLRFVLRTLTRNRGFSLLTIFTLALGIGAAAAIFSLADWALFQANRFPEGVYIVGGHTADTPFMPIRFEFMVKPYEQTPVGEFAKAASSAGNVVIDGQPVAIGWLGITPNLFPMLGVTPALGRNFLPTESAPGADQIVIVSDHFWHQYLGGTPDALGRKIVVGDSVCTVVGVLKPWQQLPPYFYSELYRPLTYKYDPRTPWLPQFFTLLKLRPNVTREQATAMLQGAKLELPEGLRPYFANDHAAIATLAENNRSLMRIEIYWMMLAAVACLYAIACLNASNLMLSRMLGQHRELSIRLALGGGRWQIIRLLVLETFLLTIAGGLVGALLANWLFPLLLHAAGNSAFGGKWGGWNLNSRVVEVMVALSLLTSVVIALVPAWRVVRTPILSGLKDGGAAIGEGRSIARLRGAMVVLQATFAVVLLFAALLMIRTFQNLRAVDLGFDPTNKVKVQLSFPPTLSTEFEPRLARLRDVQAQLLRVPGVRAAGFGNDVLLPGYYFPGTEVIGPEGKTLKVMVAAFGNGFQDASGLKLKRGSWLTHKKGDDVLVNESLARKLWPESDPIGQFIRKTERDPKAPKDWIGWRVVGVVADLRATLRDSAGLCIYGPEQWGPVNFNTFILQVAGAESDAFTGSIRRTLYAFDPQIVVGQVNSINQLRETQLWAEHMADSVFKVLAAVALLLTLVGLFSVLAYMVDCRMPEFGVRMALGATTGNLIALVVARGLVLAAIGLATGFAASVGLARYLQSLIFGTSAVDPYLLGSVCALLLLSALAACAWPAYRATKVDVARLLRAE